jgi:hypothetical protein
MGSMEVESLVDESEFFPVERRDARTRNIEIAFAERTGRLSMAASQVFGHD